MRDPGYSKEESGAAAMEAREVEWLSAKDKERKEVIVAAEAQRVRLEENRIKMAKNNERKRELWTLKKSQNVSAAEFILVEIY